MHFFNSGPYSGCGKVVGRIELLADIRVVVMALDKKETGAIDEMSIVDVFTRLIFDADSVLGETESLVVEALGQIEPSLYEVPRRDISEFLRAMGVDEMISAVGQIKRSLDQRQSVIAFSHAEGRYRLYR